MSYYGRPSPEDVSLMDQSREARIDTRDLYFRLQYLEGEILDEDESLDPLDEDERVELEELRDLEQEIDGYAGDRFRDGVMLIADTDFENYAREYADDIGNMGGDWPTNYIDWERAANDLKQDYTSVDICGREYCYR